MTAPTNFPHDAGPPILAGTPAWMLPGSKYSAPVLVGNNGDVR